MRTYSIIRIFQRWDKPSEIVKEGLTLEEAQAHCQDPETSSSTCRAPSTKAIESKYGPWFDSYREE